MGGSARRLQQYMYCDGMDTLFSFDASSGGCLSGYCEAGILGVGSVSVQLEVSSGGCGVGWEGW